MKHFVKLILALLATIISCNAMAQTSGEKIYCEVTCSVIFLKPRISVNTGRGFLNEIVVDENGNTLKFNSNVAILNHLSSKGWLLEGTYYINYDSQQELLYLMSYVLADDETPDDVYTRLTGQSAKKK